MHTGQSLLDLADMRGEVERNTIKEGVQYIVPYTKIKTENYHFYEYMEKFEVYGGRKDPRNSGKLSCEIPGFPFKRQYI